LEDAFATGEERDRVQRHAAACPACATLLAGGGQAFTWLALSLRDQPPPARVWDRLAVSIGEAIATVPLWERLAVRFGAQIASLTDLAEAQVHALLARLDDPASWSEALPGVQVFHFEGGPATAGAITGFVRIEAGGAFPEHEHVGREWNLVLRGALALPGGRVARVGDLIEMEPGSSHALGATAEEEVVFLAVALEGISIGGERVGPEDPRA
jgi:putative transcriptional regulator